MKKIVLLIAMIVPSILLTAQINKIDTSFYSQSLGKTMLVDVYFPPGYEDHPNWYYPVIYCLPAWKNNQNEMGMYYLSTLQNYINDNLIDPVMMVCANNNPPPFEGNMYVNSELWGNYEDYNVNDLIEWVESSFRVIPERDARGLIGQSMGANGAFRYSILHKDKFRAMAGHAAIVTVDKNLWLDTCRQRIMIEHPSGPPYFYNYGTNGVFTQGTFLLSGAYSPDTNSPQTYINPQVVNFVFDENCDYIDSIYQKWVDFDISLLIQQLTAEDSVGIFYGCGENDDFLLYPANLALADTLEMLELPFEFYSHPGGHNMPAGFRNRAYLFLDSLMVGPSIHTNIPSESQPKIQLSTFPNPTNESLQLSFSMEQSASVQIEILNTVGSIVLKKDLGIQPSGKHSQHLDIRHLASGIYFCKLQVGDQVVVKRLVKL